MAFPSCGIAAVTHAGKSVQEQPSPPRETSQTIAPDDSISNEEEYHEHQEYSVGENPIGSVAHAFRLLVYLSLSNAEDRQR